MRMELCVDSEMMPRKAHLFAGQWRWEQDESVVGRLEGKGIDMGLPLPLSQRARPSAQSVEKPHLFRLCSSRSRSRLGAEHAGGDVNSLGKSFQ